MPRNTIFSKAVCIATIYAFAFAVLSKPAHAVRGLAPISFDEMYSLAQSGKVEALRASVSRGLNIDTLNSDGDTGLCVAARRHDVYTYNSFRAAGAEPRHPCTQKISDYESFLEKSNVVGLEGTSREALSAMGNKETYKIGSGKWWWIGGALIAGGGVAWWLLSRHHHKSSDDSDSGGSSGDDDSYYSLGSNAYSGSGAVKKTSGTAQNAASLSYSDDSIKHLDTIDLRQNVLKNTDEIKSILYAGNGGTYTNKTDITLETGNGAIAMNAVKKSSVVNDGYINITSSNASLGMVAGENSEASNYGAGILNKSDKSGVISTNGININFSGYAENATVVGMYADTNSKIINYGDIEGKAIQSAQSTTSSESTGSSGIIDILSNGTDGNDSQDGKKTSQTTSAKGSLIGMEAMILNVGSDLHTHTIMVVNESTGRISFSAGDNGSSSNPISVSLLGMGSFLDDAFLNKSNILSRAEKVELQNNGSIYLEYSGNYTASSSTALRKGLGGIIGIRADANSNAVNTGSVDIVLHDEFEVGGVDVAAGMQSVHGGNLENSGNIQIYTPSKNYRVNYGMLAVEGSGTNSGLYSNLQPVLNNTEDGVISIQISNSYGMASFVGGSVINNGHIILGSDDNSALEDTANETYYNTNIAMYGYGNTKKTKLENIGTIDLYSHKSIAMQNDYAGGTDITNDGIINIFESAVDSYVFGGKYSNLYNNSLINYYATSAKQENAAGAGVTYNPFKNYIISLGISAISTKTRSIKSDTIDYSSSTTEAIYNSEGATINLEGSSFVAAMSVETNDGATGTQAKAYNNGTINIKDRESKNATNAIGLYIDAGSLNNAGIINNGTINTDSAFSAAMASNSLKNADVINRGVINTQKSNSLGIYITDVSNVINEGNININNSNSVAIQAGMYNTESSSAENSVFPNILNNETGVITVGGKQNFVENSFGIYVDIGGTTDKMAAQIENLGQIDVYTKNSGAGIYSQGRGVKITNKNLVQVFGNDAFGIYTGGSAEVINEAVKDSSGHIIGGKIIVGQENANVSNSFAIYNAGTGIITNNAVIDYYNNEDVYGYAIYSSGDAYITNNGDINLYNKRATAISAYDGTVINNSAVNLSNDYNTYIELTGSAKAKNNNIINVGSAQKSVNNSAAFKTTSSSSSSFVTNAGTINLYNDYDSYAVKADGNTTIENLDTGKINSYNDNSTAILAVGTVKTLNDGNITVNGSGAYGIRGLNSSIVSLHNKGIITIGSDTTAGENDEGAAVYAPTINYIYNDGTINVHNYSGYGIYAESDAGAEDGGYIINNGTIEMLSKSSVGIYTGTVANIYNNGTIQMDEENSKAIMAHTESSTIINDKEINLLKGNNSYGIYVTGPAIISNTLNSSITVGSDSDSSNPTNGNGIYAPSSSEIYNYGSISVYSSNGGGITGSGAIHNNGSIYTSSHYINNFGILSPYGASVQNNGSINIGNGYGISTTGSVTNGLTGSISTPNGISVQNASSLSNAGNITAKSEIAAIVDVGSITNNHNASIINTDPNGYAIKKADSVTNYGTISAGNTALQNVDSVSNSGNITADSGAAIQNAKTVDNSGTIDAVNGAAIQNADSLNNSGNVYANSSVAAVVNVDYVFVDQDSYIINSYSGGGYGIKNAQTVINYGTIRSSGDAIHYDSGNFTVENYGLIQSTGNGDGINVQLPNSSSSATITNGSTGTIRANNGHGINIYIPSHLNTVTIVNNGSIISNGSGIYVYKNYHFVEHVDESGNITYEPASEGTKITEGSASLQIVCTGSICTLPQQTGGTDSISGSSAGEVIDPVYADVLSSSLISADDVSILSTVNLVNRGTISTGGDVNFGSQENDSAQISIGEGGSYQADSFSGTISAEADIVEDGFADTYVNKDSFVGKNNGVKVLSKSYMFDAATAENEDGNTDIVMTLKPFSETTDDSEISTYLTQSYENQEGEQIFNTLKTAADKQQFNTYVDKELGFDTIPNFIKQSIEVERNISATTTDRLLDLNGSSHRRFAEMMMYRNNIKDKGGVTGYKDNVLAAHGFTDTEIRNNIRSGIGISVIRADSKYNNDSSRYNNTAAVFIPLIFDKDDLAALIKPKAGFSRGHYRRTGVDKIHKADTKEYFFGVDTAVKKHIDFNTVEFAPSVGFNFEQLYTGDMSETNDGLHLKSEHTLSAYSVLGMDIKKKFAVNQTSDITLAAAAKYFHEFGEKYKNHARFADAADYYKIESNRFNRDFGLVKFDLQYNLENAGFGAALIVPIENKHKPYYMLNAKYNF